MAVIALCIAFSWFASDILYIHPLTNVDQISYFDGFLGGVDVQEQSYVVFQVNLRTGEAHYLEVPKIKKEESCTLSDLCVLENGEIWMVSHLTSGTHSHLDLVRCNFVQESLETMIHLEDMPDKEFFSFVSVQGRPQVFLYNQDYGVERYQAENQELVYLDTPIAEYNENRQFCSITEDGSIYEIYADGWIYRRDRQGQAERIVKIEGSREEGWNYNYQFDEDSIYYENSRTGEWKKIDLDRKPYAPVPCERRCSPAQTFDETKFTGEYFDGGQVKCGKLFLEDGRRVPAVCGTYECVVERLSQEDKLVMFRAVASLIYSSVFLILRTVWRALKKRHIPLVAYAAALTLFGMTAGIGIVHTMIFLILQENMEQNNYETCIQLGYRCMNRYLPDNIQTMCAYPEITPQNRLPYSYDFSAYDYLTFDDTGQKQWGSSGVDVSFRLYFQKEGEIYSLPDQLYIVNTPLSYNMISCDLDALDAMERAFAGKEVVTQQYEDLDGREYSAFIPFLDTGEYPLLLEVAMSQRESNRRIAEQQIAMRRLLTRLAFVLTGAILLVIWISMKPLQSLKEAALNITRGELGARAYDRGFSEAAVTAVYFNQMAEQLAAQVSGSSAYQKKYEAFAPLWLLDGRHLSEVRQEECAVMAVKAGKKQEVACLLGEIHGHRGEALSFEDEETWCLFPEAAEDALQAAMGIVKPFRQEDEAGASIGLDYDEVRLGVIGNQSRSALETFNAGRGRTRFLRACAEKYKTPVLITQSIFRRIPDIEKRFHLRLLGRFWFKASGTAEEIYEVLDGEGADQYRKKLLTEDAFQTGRQRFETGDYPAARTAFVKVLTENQQDGAALHYIRLCDEAAAAAQKRAGLHYMEVY